MLGPIAQVANTRNFRSPTWLFPFSDDAASRAQMKEPAETGSSGRLQLFAGDDLGVVSDVLIDILLNPRFYAVESLADILQRIGD